MDLWIRSQDKKKLVKVENLYLLNLENNNYGSTGIFYIPTSYDRYDKYVNERDSNRKLGIYKSTERALEVLDEIQDLLKDNVDDKHINKFDIYNSDAIKIYEMPKE